MLIRIKSKKYKFIGIKNKIKISSRNQNWKRRKFIWTKIKKNKIIGIKNKKSVNLYGTKIYLNLFYKIWNYR